MIFDYLKNWLSQIQKNYGVNPVIFAIIYFGCAPIFWFSIYKIIAGLKNRKVAQVRVFGIILATTIVAPFVYVAIFGHNLPYWFWLFVGIIILYATYNVWLKLRNSRKKLLNV